MKTLLLLLALVLVGCSPAQEEEHHEEHHDEEWLTLAPEAIQGADIDTALAGSGTIEVAIDAPGEVKMNAERVVHVRPRFAGEVRAMKKRLGDAVRKGETLATIHSNESLSEYAIIASQNGTIVSQDAAVGQEVDHESLLYTLADLSTVWVDFPIYAQNAGAIRPGLTVRVRTETGPAVSGAGTIRYVGPILEQDTRVSYGRIVLDNRERRWQPGMFVAAAIGIERAQVPVAVPDDAVVRMAEGPAVFVAEGNRFRPQAVTVGRTDGTLTEIVEGLAPGTSYVVKNAFLLKAELGKSEAGHDH